MTHTKPGMPPAFGYRRLWQGLGWGLTGVVVVLSLIPAPPPPPLLTWDKSQHLVAYAVLMLWFAQVFRRRWLWAVFLGLLGVGLEFAQAWTGYRYCDGMDMFANTLGVAVGWGLALTPLGALAGGLDRRLTAWAAVRGRRRDRA